MASILLTGCSGRLGIAVAPYLESLGHDVHCVDRVRPHEPYGTFAMADLTDYGKVADVMAGIDE